MDGESRNAARKSARDGGDCGREEGAEDGSEGEERWCEVTVFRRATVVLSGISDTVLSAETMLTYTRTLE